MTTAQLFLCLRRTLNLRQPDFAAILGISRGTVWSIEHGQAKPSLRVFRIAHQLVRERLGHEDRLSQEFDHFYWSEPLDAEGGTPECET